MFILKLNISAAASLGTHSCTSAGQGSLNTDHRSLSWLNLSLTHWKEWLDMCTLEHLELQLRMDLKFLKVDMAIILIIRRLPLSCRLTIASHY